MKKVWTSENGKWRVKRVSENTMNVIELKTDYKHKLSMILIYNNNLEWRTKPYNLPNYVKVKVIELSK